MSKYGLEVGLWKTLTGGKSGEGKATDAKALLANLRMELERRSPTAPTELAAMLQPLGETIDQLGDSLGDVVSQRHPADSSWQSASM